MPEGEVGLSRIDWKHREQKVIREIYDIRKTRHFCSSRCISGESGAKNASRQEQLPGVEGKREI